MHIQEPLVRKKFLPAFIIIVALLPFAFFLCIRNKMFYLPAVEQIQKKSGLQPKSTIWTWSANSLIPAISSKKKKKKKDIKLSSTYNIENLRAWHPEARYLG